MAVVIQIENLVKRYKELVALDHLNLEVEEGEIFGLLGPNGSGKSTTINCILALLKYDKGTVKVFGREMKPDSYDIKREIGVVMQDVAVFDELTVYENVDYFCGLYIRDKGLRKQYVEDAIAFVGLDEFRKFYPKKLSGGLLRRLNIACGIHGGSIIRLRSSPLFIFFPIFKSLVKCDSISATTRPFTLASLSIIYEISVSVRFVHADHQESVFQGIKIPIPRGTPMPDMENE